MKSGDMLQAIARPLSVVPRRASIPVLACLHFHDGRVTGSDLERTISAQLDWDISACVPADQLKAVLTCMSRDAEVSAATVGTKLTLSCDGSRHILPTYPVRDFPRPAWTEPSKELDAAGLADRLSIRAGESTARFKLVEGKFPDVRRITPNPINHRLCAERVALHDAAQAVAGLGMGKFPFARMSVVGGVLKISTTGESEHEFAIPCDGELPDLGVAPAQLADALGALTGARVTCAVKDDMSAIVLIGDKSDRSCLVMPARI